MLGDALWAEGLDAAVGFADVGYRVGGVGGAEDGGEGRGERGLGGRDRADVAEFEAGKLAHGSDLRLEHV